MAEILRAHERESWAKRAKRYNAAAKQRGWHHDVSVATYARKCLRLQSEQQFKEGMVQSGSRGKHSRTRRCSDGPGTAA